MDFDENYWHETIKRADWYLEFSEFAKNAKLKTESEAEFQSSLNKKIRRFFENELQKGQVRLGESGHDFDSERLPINTIVIHHTSARPNYKLSYLNSVHLLNIYVPAYAEGLSRGQPIWSGHFKNGQQIFWGYHWLMRMDGSFERLLKDDQIGWHSGNWTINKSSIGICLDNDYEKQDPTDKVLQTLAKHIKKHYPFVKNIIGHCEARQGTSCPGGNFLSTWKNDLLGYLS